MTESRMWEKTPCLRDFNQFCFWKKLYGVRNSCGPKLAKTEFVRPKWVWDIFFLKNFWEKSKSTWRKSRCLDTISNSLPQWQNINNRWRNLILSLSTFFSGGYSYTTLLFSTEHENLNAEVEEPEFKFPNGIWKDLQIALRLGKQAKYFIWTCSTKLWAPQKRSSTAQCKPWIFLVLCNQETCWEKTKKEVAVVCVIQMEK